MNEVLELVISALSILSTMFGGVWFLISLWSKKSKEIKQLEGSILSSEIDGLKREVDKHQKTIAVATHEIKLSREEIIKVQGRLDTLNVKLEVSNEKLSQFHEDTRDRLLNIENTMINGELVSVGKGKVMIRARKGQD